MTETLAKGYSSESAHRELSNEYQYDRVSMHFETIFASLWFEESSLSILFLKICYSDIST